MDRKEINRALAKAMAYKACGNRQAEAEIWAAKLIWLLECEGILADKDTLRMARDLR